MKLLFASGLLCTTVLAVAQSLPPTTPINEIQPSPPSIGADVPATYFGPPPSSVQKELVGPVQLLKSGTIDLDKGTITLPLYKGRMRSGEAVWYILTDTNDQGNAEALGINYSAKLTYAEVGKGVRTASQDLINGKTVVTFEAGRVNFAPVRSVTPGTAPNYFPPTAVTPGGIGDSRYSPLAKIGEYIYNAPTMAQGESEATLNAYCNGSPDYSKVHDKVVAICPKDQTVTLKLTTGFSFAKPVLYLSTDANSKLAAAMEAAVYAPGLQDVKVGSDDSAFSAVERIFSIRNGPTNTQAGVVNPQRQGFDSALKGEGSPLNVLGGIPTVATDYSPLWDLNLGEWTQAAVSKHYRSRVRGEFQILGYVRSGWITGIGGKPFGSTGLIINCPIAYRFL